MARETSVPSFHLSICPSGLPGAENMAIDQALLEESDRTGRAFLRLYRFDPRCLSFGRNEPARQRYDRDAIARLGIDVVRRPTGGRAVWHEHEVTYAVAAPLAAFGGDPRRGAACCAPTNRAIHQRLAAALRALGADATLAPYRRPPTSTDLHHLHGCFATPVGGEVLVHGRKVIGSAQVRQGRAFLQHGSILLAGSQAGIGAVSRRPAGASGETTLSAVLGRPVTFGEVAEAVLDAFAGDGVGGHTAALPTARPPDRLTAAFRDPAWTWRR
jgi:lipoate-protein ligase A